MKHQKDITELFTTSQHKLTEQPPARAWRRLERRLDQHARHQRQMRQRPYLIAASILFISAILMGLVLVIDQQQEAMMAQEQNRLKSMELLVSQEDDLQKANQVIAYNKQVQSHLAKPIEEGVANKKLLPTQVQSTVSLNNSNGWTTFNPLSEPRLAQALSDTTAALLQKISLLKWLFGYWQNDTGAKSTLDIWHPVNTNTIEGKGLIALLKDTFLIERMQIQQLGDQVFLSVKNPDQEKPNWYKLTQQNEKKAVFENRMVDFPNKIAFQLVEDSLLVTSYIGNEETEFTPVQKELYEQRNVLSPNLASRRLVKVF